jgi:hypothetical protein
MVKAVECVRDLPEMECGGCCFDVRDKCLRVDSCPGINLIVKDLGILRNGKLPSSFGVYPTTQAPSEENENWFLYAWLKENGEIIRKEWAFGKTEQQAIDAWNRRV